MNNQIFKKSMPIEILYELLDEICVKTDKCYILNSEYYKKGIYKGTLPIFFEKCKEYYYTSKRKYLEKKLTYNAFTTVLRQICNFKNITYASKIKYDKSNYDIIYYIYYQ